MPKPGAHFYGTAMKDLAFIRMPETNYKLETPEPAATGLVTVTGGRLTAEVVQKELARITRADWQWEGLPHEEVSFLVAFPNYELLQSMADIGFNLKNHGATITVSAWQNS
jgi:hypothetical protein